MSRKSNPEEWDKRYDAIQARVAREAFSECLVMFSAYPMDADGLPVDNLDERAVEGRCRFFQKVDPNWGGGKDYVSAEVENPTWLLVAVLANEMIQVTGDRQHVFLEGVTMLSEQNGVKMIDFNMGS